MSSTIYTQLDELTLDSNPIAVGLDQIETVLSDCPIFPHDQLSVLAADSYYSQRQFLKALGGKPHAIIVTRARSNRVFYHQPEIVESVERGHCRWYGERFDLKDETTWHDAEEIVETSLTTRRGRNLDLTITCWHQMLMRGTKEYPMHQHPFTLLRVQVTEQTTGKLLWRPMWLIVMGQRRHELTPLELTHAYRQRFDMEHMLRFGKQQLLMGSFQTPDVEHEENWVQLTLLAYVQLLAARELVDNLPRPWDKYYHKKNHHSITPSLIQRDFLRIIRQIGTPAVSPKPRGFSPGRIPGNLREKRKRHPVIKKGKKMRYSTRKAA